MLIILYTDKKATFLLVLPFFPIVKCITPEASFAFSTDLIYSLVNGSLNAEIEPGVWISIFPLWLQKTSLYQIMSTQYKIKQKVLLLQIW